MVIQVPEATRIVSHGINGAGYIVVPGHITVVTLVQGIQAQQVGTG